MNKQCSLPRLAILSTDSMDSIIEEVSPEKESESVKLKQDHSTKIMQNSLSLDNIGEEI